MICTKYLTLCLKWPSRANSARCKSQRSLVMNTLRLLRLITHSWSKGGDIKTLWCWRCADTPSSCMIRIRFSQESVCCRILTSQSPLWMALETNLAQLRALTRSSRTTSTTRTAARRSSNSRMLAITSSRTTPTVWLSTWSASSTARSWTLLTWSLAKSLSPTRSNSEKCGFA